jgi:hypothetical protein
VDVAGGLAIYVEKNFIDRGVAMQFTPRKAIVDLSM